MSMQQDPGDFVITPEIMKTLRVLEGQLTPDEWEKMLNGDPAARKPLGVLVAPCKEMTKSERESFRRDWENFELVRKRLHRLSLMRNDGVALVKFDGMVEPVWIDPTEIAAVVQLNRVTLGVFRKRCEVAMDLRDTVENRRLLGIENAKP